MKKIVLCGGGTAGHIFPALAVAEKLQNFEIHYFGGNGMEKEILKNFSNITFHEIPVVKLQRKLTAKNLLIPIKLFKSIKSTKKELQKVSPDVIFSKGGYVSVPVAIAGKKLNIPVISHESDLSFGLANRIILHNANLMCTSFAETCGHNKKCVHTGQPIRDKIFKGKKLELGFNHTLPTILILGGSLGAKFLNDIVQKNLQKLLQKFNIIHICGKKNFEEIKDKINHMTFSKQNYLLLPFADNIEDYYCTVDMVVARAGSGVINELLALEKPMMLVPLSKKCSRGDQIENAKLFAKKGYCEMLEEEECNFNNFINKLEKLQKNTPKIKKNMQKEAKSNASDEIAKIISGFVKQEK